MDYCHDIGKPGCLGERDPRFDMDYTDVPGGSVLYWCSACGPEAHQIDAMLNKALADNPEFAEKFRSALETVEQSRATH